MAHLSRLAAPKTWPIKRKGIKWVVKPVPGPHRMYSAMPLQIYLTDLLKLAKNRKEVRSILNRGFVLVNGKVVKENKFPVGLFDILKISEYNECYRVVFNNKGKLQLVKIPEAESNILLAKVKGKTTVKGGKVQVLLSNGWTFIAEKDAYKINDGVLVDAKTKKPIDYIKLENETLVYVAGGKHTGSIGRVKDFAQEGLLRKKRYAIVTSDQASFKIPLREVYPIGKEESKITLQ